MITTEINCDICGKRLIETHYPSTKIRHGCLSISGVIGGVGGRLIKQPGTYDEVSEVHFCGIKCLRKYLDEFERYLK